MALMRRSRGSGWDPWRELEEMSGRLNRLFGYPMAEAESGEKMSLFDWSPSVNIRENDKAFMVEAELPGVKKEDIKLTIEKGVMRIEGERRERKEEKDEKIHRVESSYGSFMRSFTLPADAAEDGVEANYKDGMLTVRVPKTAKKEAAKKQISVG